MDFFETDPFAAPIDEILERNLDALARTSPQAARLIRMSTARVDLEFIETDEGVLSASIGDGRLLASRRKPRAEAERLADTVDVTEVAGVAVLGFGLGHHLAVLAERLNKTGILLCFEPDLALLRAVFEKIDCSAWMLRTNFALVTDPEDGASITRVLSGLEGVIALGVKILDHPPSRERLGSAAQVFGQRFTDVLKAIRTAIVTTLVQSDVTLRNVLMNLDYYACCDGVRELGSSCLGVPAVVVAAGPSLERNIDELAKPGVRDRVVIIAVQTVLKPLLARGIRPHFVCALDHHEISTRFYEGLTASDVEGVTLVVDPKANAAILDAFPGAIRTIGNDLLDLLIDQARLRGEPKGELKPGATVAHQCYYLARHLGCDPVLLCGQDLGFTDGQYYAAGAAIHDVWACELGPMNTLEMMEWERIAREKSLLRRKTDIFGRSIFTDEQMATYLAQFEADFLADSERGLRTVDATEGGVAKQHTVSMSLFEAIEAYGSPIAVTLPPSTRHDLTDHQRGALTSAVLSVRGDARRVVQLSRDTVRLLKKLRRAVGDPARANELIGRIHTIRDQVTTMGAAFRMTQFLNQAGTLNRVKADRAIELEMANSEHDRQRLRVERDIANVEAIAKSAETLIDLLESTNEALAGGVKRTRDRLVVPPGLSKGRARRRRVCAFVHVDFERGGLATTRDIESSFAGGPSILKRTVQRLLSAHRLHEVVCLTDDPDRLGLALGELSGRVVTGELDLVRMRSRLDAIGAGRRMNPTAWRGGIASLTCYDEVFEPASCLATMTTRDIDAAVLVGADWCLTDPTLIDAIVNRYAEHPDALRVVFSQSPPGLGAILVDRMAMGSLANNAFQAGPFATIGALLGYVPFAPQADPIAQPMCIPVSPRVRDLSLRCIPDTPANAQALALVIGAALDGMTSDLVVAEVTGIDHTRSLPIHIEIELTDENTNLALGLIESLQPGSAVTLRGSRIEDHVSLGSLVDACRSRQVTSHVRTDLCGEQWQTLGAIGCDVVSVDMHAVEPVVYKKLTGHDDYQVVQSRLEQLMRERNEHMSVGGLPLPWFVPRMTRCDEVYEQIELFYDGWLKACGCAVIDAAEQCAPGARIQPLPLPESALRLERATACRLRSDGSVVGCDGLNAYDMGLSELWRRVLQRRGALSPMNTHHVEAA